LINTHWLSLAGDQIIVAKIHVAMVGTMLFRTFYLTDHCIATLANAKMIEDLLLCQENSFEDVEGT